MKKLLTILAFGLAVSTTKAQLYINGQTNFLNIKSGAMKAEVKSISSSSLKIGYAFAQKFYLGFGYRVQSYKLSSDFSDRLNVGGFNPQTIPNRYDLGVMIDFGYIFMLDDKWKLRGTVGIGSAAFKSDDFTIYNNNNGKYYTTYYNTYTGSCFNIEANAMYNFNKNIGVQFGLSLYHVNTNGTYNVTDAPVTFADEFKGSTISFNTGFYFQLFNKKSE